MSLASDSTSDFSSFIEEMKWRGFFQQCTDEENLTKLLDEKTVTAYIGFDPTADSLHVGSLVPIMGLLIFQSYGHKPIAIVGGATAMVGDPSGKTELRKMATPETITANMEGVRKQLSRFVRFDDSDDGGLMLNNADWLSEWGYIDFLREVGRHFSVNQMLTRDSVKSRLETGLSFIEFNYMILQAYDFMVLNRDYGCQLEMGGNDQWGNICSGIDLCRRVNRQEVYGLTYPLIMTASGEKMGKTAAGAVWLDENRTSAYDFFQYWINIDDRDVSRFLRLFARLPKAEIERLEKLEGADIREAKKALARAVTTTVHGEKAAADAETAATALFATGGDTSTVPSSERSVADFEGEGCGLLDVLVATGMLKSNGEARRMVRQNAVRLGGELVTDENRLVTTADIEDGRIVLQIGKKRHHHVLVV